MLESMLILLIVGFLAGYFASHFMWTKWIANKLDKVIENLKK